MYDIILAMSTREANAYAKACDMPRGSYRYATRASTIKGLRMARVHVLPSFNRRLDKHSIKAVLRYAKIPELIEVDPEDWVWPRPAAEPEVEDQGDGMGPQIDIFEALAAVDTIANLDASAAALVESVDESEQAAIDAATSEGMSPEGVLPTPVAPVSPAPKPTKPKGPKPRAPRPQKPKPEPLESLEFAQHRTPAASGNVFNWADLEDAE